jgi:hypothetical protein
VNRIAAARGACRILDVGGQYSFWKGMRDLWQGSDVHITLANLTTEPVDDSRFTSVAADARAMTAFADGAFDLVHSNSVIEHVGQWSDMRAMAGEIRRLAPSYFVQTPNFWFPVEPHLRAPLIHWLPRPWRRAIVHGRSWSFYGEATTLDRAQTILQDASLLDAASMAELFPDAVIERERVALLTKSLIAIKESRTLS